MVKYYYHPDHLGSTTLVTNQSGSVVEDNTYYPFGDIYSGDADSRYLYTGQELDEGTGFYDYGARLYSSRFMHFLQPDPIISDIYDPQNLNHYSYVLNNPYKYTDPTGNVAVYFGALGQLGAFVGIVGSGGFVATYSFSNGLQVGTYTKGGFGGFTTPTVGGSLERGIAPFVNSLSEFGGSSYDLGFDIGEGVTVGGGIGLPRDSAGNIDPKGFSIEGSFAPLTDYNPPIAPASLYGGVSTTSVNCILGCGKDAGNKGVTDLVSNEISSTPSQSSQQTSNGNNNKPVSSSKANDNKQASTNNQNSKNSWWRNWWSKTQSRPSRSNR